MNVCRTSCKILQEMRLNCIFAKAKLQNAHRNTKEKRGFFLRNALSLGIYTEFMQNYILFPSFIQNLTQFRHLIPNRFQWIVEQMVDREFEAVASYVENKRATRCQQENERWQEAIFSATNCTITV